MATETHLDLDFDTAEFDAACDELADALHYLESMGTKREIAEYLTGHGIKGARMRACLCPVAKWLQTRFSTELVSVGTYSTIARFTDSEHMAHAKTPANIAAFILGFDQGEFPALDEEVEEIAA